MHGHLYNIPPLIHYHVKDSMCKPAYVFPISLPDVVTSLVNFVNAFKKL